MRRIASFCLALVLTHTLLGNICSRSLAFEPPPPPTADQSAFIPWSAVGDTMCAAMPELVVMSVDHHVSTPVRRACASGNCFAQSNQEPTLPAKSNQPEPVPPTVTAAIVRIAPALPMTAEVAAASPLGTHTLIATVVLRE